MRSSLNSAARYCGGSCDRLLFRCRDPMRPRRYASSYACDAPGKRLTTSATSYSCDDSDQMLTAGAVAILSGPRWISWGRRMLVGGDWLRLASRHVVEPSERATGRWSSSSGTSRKQSS